jgi:hypothetical protein
MPTTDLLSHRFRAVISRCRNIMADQREIDDWRNAYKSYSRAQLIAVMHSKVEYSAEHIAAKQRLDELDRAEVGKAKADATKQSQTRHEQMMRWMKIGVGVAIFIGVAQFARCGSARTQNTMQTLPPSATQPTATVTPMRTSSP